ncbi:TraU family protein [Thalassotalea piscium]|uniref:Conjugal transfer pilus assembly protein TraU n=1 Tax=Thalassotalea piscium TaxID=1230533 RepID=A0A7X0NGK9_9GAMM|nr:TraU family protein [Thalassotalea piscium]MBB6543069.1 conjugal transfer pilus assembly protein TraU [Thalassotalea piscium]
MKFFLIVILTFLSFTFSPKSLSATTETPLSIDDITCPNSKIIGKALITDVCWEGIFPVYLGGARFGGKSKFAPADRNKRSLCFCQGDISKGVMPSAGATVGMYLPKYLLTVTKKPYCFPELNGTELASQLGLVSRFNVGNEDAGGTDSTNIANSASFSWHLAAMPLMKILELFDVMGCYTDGYTNFDIMWISETLPMWYDSELAYYIAPESKVFASSLASAAVVTDCLSSSLASPIDTLFFAAGCWGQMYPLTAHIGGQSDKVAGKSLIATRALFFLSRIGVLERTMGDDAVCKSQDMPIMKKSQYRFQQLWPLSESESMDVTCQEDQACDANTVSTTLGPQEFSGNLNKNGINQIQMNSLNETCTHPIGQTTFSWGIWRDAIQPDHASYLIFQWNDCCADIIEAVF